jgi:hypothetical protein
MNPRIKMNILNNIIIIRLVKFLDVISECCKLNLNEETNCCLGAYHFNKIIEQKIHHLIFMQFYELSNRPQLLYLFYGSSALIVHVILFETRMCARSK